MSSQDHINMFSGSVSATLEKAHDFAMSTDDALACQGRCVKLVVNLLDNWLTDERKRGSSAVDVVFAARCAGLGLLVSTIASLVKPGHAASAAIVMREEIIASWDRSIAELRRQGR